MDGNEEEKTSGSLCEAAESAECVGAAAEEQISATDGYEAASSPAGYAAVVAAAAAASSTEGAQQDGPTRQGAPNRNSEGECTSGTGTETETTATETDGTNRAGNEDNNASAAVTAAAITNATGNNTSSSEIDRLQKEKLQMLRYKAGPKIGNSNASVKQEQKEGEQKTEEQEEEEGRGGGDESSTLLQNADDNFEENGASSETRRPPPSSTAPVEPPRRLTAEDGPVIMRTVPSQPGAFYVRPIRNSDHRRSSASPRMRSTRSTRVSGQTSAPEENEEGDLEMAETGPSSQDEREEPLSDDGVSSLTENNIGSSDALTTIATPLQAHTYVEAIEVVPEETEDPRQDDILVRDAEEVDEVALKINRMVAITKSRKFRRGLCLALIAIAIVVDAALIGTSVAKSKCQAPDKAKLGDGICDAGAAYNTETCNFDEGDCDQYNALVEQGCGVSASDASRLGDGVCDGGIFVSDGCNLDDGDCEPIAWDPVGNPIVGENAGDESGAAIAFSADGKVLAIAAAKNSGASGIPNSGHVRVHSYTGSDWIQLGDDIDGGEADGDSFGISIAMSSDGTRITVGANRQVSNQTGFAIVYEYGTGIDKWVQIGNRLSRTPGSGPDVFGSAVAMSADGSIVAIGSPLANGNGTMQGACHTYKYNSSADTWEEIGVIDGGVDMAFSAGSLSMSSDGTRLAIGAPFDNAGGIQRGTTRIYDYQESDGGWIKLGDSIPGEDGDGSGWSVSLAADGSKLAVGSPSQDRVRVYSYNEVEEEWQIVGADIVGKAKGDEFGGAVSTSSDGMRLAVGAKSSRIGRGQVRVFQYDEASQTWLQVATDIHGSLLLDALGWSVSMSADGTRMAIGKPGVGSADSELPVNGSVRVFEEPPGLNRFI